MKTRPEFKKDAYDAAKLCVDAGLYDVVIAFDYKGQEIDGKVSVKFFQLHAREIVEGVDKGDLTL